LSNVPLVAGRPVVHPTYAKMLCLTLRSLGVDVDAALRKADMPPWADLSTSDALLDQETVSRLIVSALEASGKPWLGVAVGAAVPVSAHGPLGNALVASQNLEQALETLARFGGLRYAAFQYTLRQEQGGVQLALTELVDLGAARTFVSSMVFAILLRLMETVVGFRLEHITVEFPFPEPDWRKELEQLCSGRLRFDRPSLAFHLDATALQSPCLTADAQAFAVACEQCAQLQFESTLLPFKLRVLELLNSKEGNYPSLVDVAHHFHISERTLIRRLQRESSSYQALLDLARQQRAVWYLCHSNLTIEEIAARIGFQDPTNFSRVYRRWLGCLPSETRRVARG